MNNKKKKLSILFLVLLGGFLLTACGASQQESAKAGSPLEALPPWIKPLTPTGLRADWSGDSQRLLFLDQLVAPVVMSVVPVSVVA